MTFMMGINFFSSMGNAFYIDVNISKLQLFSVCMDLHEWKTLNVTHKNPMHLAFKC